MFSDNQMEKVTFFATMTKITNECFKKCININLEKEDLTKVEATCLKNCSESYIKLREFVEVQILEDYESVKNKNRKILDDET